MIYKTIIFTLLIILIPLASAQIGYDNSNLPRVSSPTRISSTSIVSYFNATYNNLLNQMCPVGQVINGTLANGTFVCTTVASGSTFNATYNNLINQQCKVGQVVNGTLANGTLTCINDAVGNFLTNQVNNNVNMSANVSFNSLNLTNLNTERGGILFVDNVTGLVNATNETFTFEPINSRIIIGIDSPNSGSTTLYNIVGARSAAASGFHFTTFADSAVLDPRAVFRRSRGTQALPTSLNQSDAIMDFFLQPRGSTLFVTTGTFQGYVDGVTNGNLIPTAWRWCAGDSVTNKPCTLFVNSTSGVNVNATLGVNGSMFVDGNSIFKQNISAPNICYNNGTNCYINTTQVVGNTTVQVINATTVSKGNGGAGETVLYNYTISSSKMANNQSQVRFTFAGSLSGGNNDADIKIRILYNTTEIFNTGPFQLGTGGTYYYNIDGRIMRNGENSAKTIVVYNVGNANGFSNVTYTSVSIPLSNNQRLIMLGNGSTGNDVVLEMADVFSYPSP